MPVLWRRVVIFFAALMPLAWLIFSIQHVLLGADPAKALVVFTGTWAFYFLLITLAVTPLRRLIHTKTLHFNWLGAHRRMLGLFCLFYACLHLLAFFVCILGLDASRFGNEILQRPYILVSLPAFLGLIILGATSTQAMMRRLASAGFNGIKAFMPLPCWRGYMCGCKLGPAILTHWYWAPCCVC